jgi:EmrB/QacA subfamily drug resistance transporter
MSANGASLASSSASPRERNPWVVLIVICTAVFMLLLDTTIVNNAQVKIREGLNANLTEIQWVLDSYILTYAVFLLSLGRLGDIFGRKRLFLIGMFIFTLASGLCGISSWVGDLVGVSGVNALIAARVLQGFGGAMMMPQSLSLLMVAFPPEKRGSAMGIWGSVVGLGAIAGPVIGGYLVTHYAWEWVFLINIPVGVAALTAAVRIIPESTDPHASRRLDWTGLVLSGIGILALVYGVIEGNIKGWTNPVILGSIVLGLVLIALFVVWESRVPDPMMKIELFRDRNFSLGNFIALAVSFGMLGIFFPMTIYMQGILGYSAVKAGLAMSPMSIVMLFAAPVSGRLSDRIGARYILLGGLTTMAVGILYLAHLSTLDATPVSLLPALIVTGLGMGFTFSPMTAATMRDVPPRISGSASGILNTMRNIGQVLGIAVLGSVLQHQVGVHVGDRLQSQGLESGQRATVVDLAQQSQFERIQAVVGNSKIGLVLEAVSNGFTASIHNTFTVGAIICFLAAGGSWFLRDPVRRRATVAEEVLEPTGAIAD